MISHSRSESRNERSDQETCCRDCPVVFRLKSKNIVNTWKMNGIGKHFKVLEMMITHKISTLWACKLINSCQRVNSSMKKKVLARRQKFFKDWFQVSNFFLITLELAHIVNFSGRSHKDYWAL